MMATEAEALAGLILNKLNDAPNRDVKRVLLAIELVNVDNAAWMRGSTETFETAIKSLGSKSDA